MTDEQTTKLIPALDDKDADFRFIAMKWSNVIESWMVMSLGRNKEEILEHAAYWKGKGETGIKLFKCKPLHTTCSDRYAIPVR